MYTDIVVVGQPRSGTQLLCGLLNQHPKVKMLEREPLKKFKNKNFDFSILQKLVVDSRVSNKSVVGFVIQSTDLVSHPHLRNPVLEFCKLPSTFVINIHRRNRLRQAISYLHADSSKEWTSHVGSPRRNLPKSILVDVDKIFSLLKLLDEGSKFQKTFIEKYNFTINYENFYTTYNKVCNQIFKSIDLPKCSVLPTTRITHGKALIEWVLNYEELFEKVFQSEWQDHL